MRSIIKCTLLIFLSAAMLACPPEPAPYNPPVEYKPEAGPYTTVSELVNPVWVDGDRGWSNDWQVGENWQDTREIPVRVYAPDLSYDGTFPLILISHGLWGNANESLVYLAEHLASYGYIVVSVQHHRSDTVFYAYYLTLTSVQQIAVVSQQETRELRPADMSFVLDTIIDNSHGVDLLTDRVDTDRIAVMGHSFGAFTTLALNGMEMDDSFQTDARVLCGVAFSPQGSGSFGAQEDAWDGITNPMMTMGGTNDTSIGTTDPADRREPFDNMPAGDKYHATLQDAEHTDFGYLNGGPYWDGIKQMTIAFFDTYLLNDAAALSWLQSKDVEDIFPYVTLESK